MSFELQGKRSVKYEKQDLVKYKEQYLAKYEEHGIVKKHHEQDLVTSVPAVI